jgi:hypothetical protein
MCFRGVFVVRYLHCNFSPQEGRGEGGEGGGKGYVMGVVVVGLLMIPGTICTIFLAREKGGGRACDR